MGPMLERSLIAVAIAAFLVSSMAALKWWQRRKAGGAQALLTLERAKLAVVFFHSPACGVCHASQKPILDRLMARIGPRQLQLVDVDVSEEVELARAWGVATVPSTYVLDLDGRVAHINNGLAGEPVLRRQLAALGAEGEPVAERTPADRT